MNEKNEFHTVRGYQLIDHGKNTLTSAMEDYLEMIYRNSLKVGPMRISTLSELLNVHPSSATKMVQKLTNEGLIDYKKYGIIFLTEKGMKFGEFLFRRHNILESFFETLGISDNPFVETELIEHHISPQTLQNIELFNKFTKENPDIAERFERYKAEIENQ